MTWEIPARVLIMEAAGTGLLLAAFALEVTDQPLDSELALSLGAAVLFLAAASLCSTLRRTWLAIIGGISLMLVVAGLVRITQQPVLNCLHILPLVLIAYAARTGRASTQRLHDLQRERTRARRDGEEQERRRWARELHDDTLQGLGAVQIVLASSTACNQPEALRGAIDEARGLIGTQITALRHLIADLRPPVLDQLGLRPALEALCRRASQTFGLSVGLHAGPDWDRAGERLGPEAQAHVYRIVQEAVTNAVKHAHPSRITVELSCDSRTITVVVKDDGRGMPKPPGTARRALRAASPAPEGMGLPAIGERADLLGAQLRIRSVPGEGTRVILRIPRPRPEGDNRGPATDSSPRLPTG